MNRKSSQGFILASACIMLVIVGILVLAVLGRVSSVSRFTANMTGRGACRFAAQSAIEDAKQRIYDAFYQYSGGSNVRIGMMSKSGTAFEWFDSGVGWWETDSAADGHKKIGLSPYIVTFPVSTNINGCAVRLRVGKVLKPSDNNVTRFVVLRATASFVNTLGQTVSSSIEETIRFGLNRSRVFDYAYFVNNYGWFSSSTCKANGDIRANGNVSITSRSPINGNIYAAPNAERGATGQVLVKNGSQYGTMQNRSDYWNSCGDQARPTSPTSDGGATYTAGYDAPETVTAAAIAGRINDVYHENLETAAQVNMPCISDLTDYITYAKEQEGTIKQGGTTLVNAYYDGAGPSGDATLADKGSIKLVGTLEKPIEISGPVVIASDVMISGYVKGNGTIYSGRNIHIVSDLKYVNPPVWEHPDSTPTETDTQNASADLLGLAAKGNIVLGDCNTSAWINQVDENIKHENSSSVVQPYLCDKSDTSIGYPDPDTGTKFSDYTAKDGGSRVETTETTTYKDGQEVTTYTSKSVNDRCYYQSVISELEISKYASDNISRIDAVLYNNHAIMGYIGNCTFNGALICRDEAITYGRNHPYDGRLTLNWDCRLSSKSSGGSSFSSSLPMDASKPPQTVDWREIPDALTAY